MSTRLTLYGIYNWDNTLFDGLVLPPRFNRADMVNVIIEKSGDLYPYYQTMLPCLSLKNYYYQVIHL